MIREIEINNTKIRYDLQYKKVKNINLRIKPDGSINVSANRRVPQKAIDEFVMSKAEFIIRALDKYKNKSNEASKQIYSETEVKELILNLCEKVYPCFEKRGIKYPTIKFRKMISQWGNCRSEKGVLTFNTNLMYAPLECIEYVVLHELTHLKVQNHNKLFEALLTKYMPQWRARRKELNEFIALPIEEGAAGGKQGE